MSAHPLYTLGVGLFVKRIEHYKALLLRGYNPEAARFLATCLLDRLADHVYTKIGASLKSNPKTCSSAEEN